jgi:hypothetical protein
LDRDTGINLGVTTPSNNIYLFPSAYSSKAQFVDVITHETGHAIFNKSGVYNLAEKLTKNMGEFSGSLDNFGHVSIRKMSIKLFNENPWLKKLNYMQSTYFQRFLKNSNSTLDKLLEPLIKAFKF